jgi:hypothetical protein
MSFLFSESIQFNVSGEEKESGSGLIGWKKKQYFIDMVVGIGIIVRDNDRQIGDVFLGG